jgi:threonine/homoserine/homoserine lactone efflux protein
MDTLNFAATVILLTASGALAPGPLFFVTISHGARSGAKSGLVFSIAHTLVEFTLVMLLACGLLAVANVPVVKLTVGVVGGIVLLVFGVMQIRNSLTSKFSEAKSGDVATRNLLLIGLAFTGLNPFFIVWWLTVGAKLILLSLEFASLAGVVFMYICHVWMDYVWLTSVAHFSKMGTNVVGFKWYKLLMAVFGAVLIYFGLNFLFNVAKF